MMRSLPIMIALDADKDGEISAKEIENAVAALKTLDKNEDGKLTEEELRPDFAAFGRGRGGPGGRDPQEMITRLMENDKDGDEKISKEEMPEQMARMFDRADEDKDGFLTKEELEKTFASRGAGRRGGGGDGEDRPSRPQRPE
jgi:Ca2+-binding EF-hand superfamily protein